MSGARAASWTAAAALCLLVLAGCERSAGPPIADSLFVEILTDLHIAEAEVAMREDADAALRDSVLDAHGTTTGRFEETLEFYANDPEAYLEIYNAVINRLNQMEQEERRAASADTTAVLP